MTFYVLLGVGGGLGLLYALMVLGFVDRMSERQLRNLRRIVTVLLLAAGIWGALQGTFLLLLICLLLGLPLARHLLNPERDLLPAAAAGDAITHAESLRVLELDADEADATAVTLAYDKLIALVPMKRRASSYYARKLKLARTLLLAEPRPLPAPPQA